MSDYTEAFLSPEGFLAAMKSIDREDKEVAHGIADELMCRLLESLGYGEGVKEFENMAKWYS